MIDIGTALASLKAARAVAANYEDLPLKSALVEAYDGILSVKEQALEMQEDLHRARRRILELEQQLEAKVANPRDGLVFDRQAYWASASREHDENGPFCMHCLDRGVGRRRLVPDLHQGYCEECTKAFNVWPEKYRSREDHVMW